MSKDQEKLPGLNVLCIDAGGARGLSSLIVLQEVMHRLRGLKQNGEPLIPADHFDYIAGSGTGGVSACMLGKLRMPIDKAIEEYAKLMKTVFTEKKVLGSTAYKAKKLQQALGAMIQEVTGNAEEKMLGKEEDEKCKTAVFAMAKKNMNACLPVVFRSYRVDTDPSLDCTIREALHATMAHPDLFKSIDIGNPSLKQSFVGGEIGCSNPTVQVLTEIKKLYPNRHVACILSIGAGHARTIQVPDPSLVQKLFRTQDVVAMKQMATDCERVAEEMGVRFQATSGVYFRLNVDQGIQSVLSGSWEQLSDVLDHTKSYLRKSEVNGTMERATQSISERRATVLTKLIDGQIPGEATKRPTRLKRCPAPTPVYTGCDTEAEQLENCLTKSDNERCVCVVHGLGGVGKTQLALNVIERTRDKWDCVIYVDASSEAAIKNTLQDLAVVKGVGETHEDAIDWLEGYYEQWLLVLDNADDQALVTKLRQYLPAGPRGKIIITTRLTDLAVLAKGAGSSCHLSSMSQEDGLALLIKVAHMEGQILSATEMEATIALLQDFGYFALAIVHAGAYMRQRSVSIAKYRELYLSRRRDILEHSGRFHGSVDDYGKSVFTTWDLNYGLLQEPSKQILWLMAFLHYGHIHEDLFKRAAQNMHSDEYTQPIPLTEAEIAARVRLKENLSVFLDSHGHWDTLKFSDAMAELTSCSLVHLDRMNLAYSIHVLVQDWVRIRIPQTFEIASECAATFLSTSMLGLQDNEESFVFERQLWLHVNNLIERKLSAGPSHGFEFAHLCLQMGKWDQAERLAKGAMNGYKQRLGEEHPATCMSAVAFALIYLVLGQHDEAEKQGMQALNLCKTVLGEDHVITLMAKECLAQVYSGLGRLDDAKHLQTQVFQSRTQRLGGGHPDTLRSIDNLAQTYSFLGQWDMAEEMWMGALKIQERLLNEEHPDILDTMNRLVMAYSFLGRHKEAEQLQVRILNSSKQSLRGSHLRNLGIMDLLAFNHTLLGQWDEAAKLQTQIIGARKRLLGEEHPHTLERIQCAMVTQARLGQGSDVELLLTTALGNAERMLENKRHDIQLHQWSRLLFHERYKGVLIAVVISYPLLWMTVYQCCYGSKLSVYLLLFAWSPSILYIILIGF